MTRNIFLELELFLDPPIDTVGAMKEHLEKEKTPDWNKRINNEPKYKTFVAKAKSYIADGCPSLEQQGKEARTEKYAELESQAKTIITSGVTERKVKNLVNDFIKFFREGTIKKLVPLESSSSNQSEDEFVVPASPASLKCDKPVSFTDMVKISDDLREVGKKDLYDLLGISQSNESEIPRKVKDLEKRVRDTSSTDYKKDVLNRLHGRCALYFKEKSHQKGYDVAKKRYRFDEFANKILKHYVDGWIEKKKTDWKQYHVLIDEVKKLEYTQDEAAWLVYEYFCHPSLSEKRKCPLPEMPKKGAGWGKHEVLRSHLVFLFNDSIEYHRSSNPRIKNKLQSVIEQLNEIDDPDSVGNTVKKIIEDLRTFWDKCKYDGIASIPLFKPTTLATALVSYPNLKNSFQHFTP